MPVGLFHICSINKPRERKQNIADGVKDSEKNYEIIYSCLNFSNKRPKK